MRLLFKRRTAKGEIRSRHKDSSGIGITCRPTDNDTCPSPLEDVSDDDCASSGRRAHPTKSRGRCSANCSPYISDSNIIEVALGAAEAVMDPGLPKVGFSLRSLPTRYTELDLLADRAFENGKLTVAFQKYQQSLQLKHRSLLLTTTAQERNRALVHMATSINNLAYMYQIHQKASMASTLSSYEAVASIKRYVHGPHHTSVGTALNNVGSAQFAQGHYIQAIISYRKSRKILRRNFGLEHLDISTISSNIGDVFYHLGQWKNAATEFRAALRLRWTLLGKEDPKVVRIMKMLAETEMRMAEDEDVNNQNSPEQDDDDGSFIIEVERLQSEIDEDLHFLNMLEQNAPREMIQDKTSVFKELRLLNEMKAGDESGLFEELAPENSVEVGAEHKISIYDIPNHHVEDEEDADALREGDGHEIFKQISADESSRWEPPETITCEVEAVMAFASEFDTLIDSTRGEFNLTANEESRGSDSESYGSIRDDDEDSLSFLLGDVTRNPLHPDIERDASVASGRESSQTEFTPLAELCPTGYDMDDALEDKVRTHPSIDCTPSSTPHAETHGSSTLDGSGLTGCPFRVLVAVCSAAFLLGNQKPSIFTDDLVTYDFEECPLLTQSCGNCDDGSIEMSTEGDTMAAVKSQDDCEATSCVSQEITERCDHSGTSETQISDSSRRQHMDCSLVRQELDTVSRDHGTTNLLGVKQEAKEEDTTPDICLHALKAQDDDCDDVTAVTDKPLPSETPANQSQLLKPLSAYTNLVHMKPLSPRKVLDSAERQDALVEVRAKLAKARRRRLERMNA